MEHDSTGLSAFYASAAGQVVRRVILRRLRDFWPDVKGTRLLGYGFAIPYLRSFAGEAERVVALLPEQLGPMAWPAGWCLTALTQEDALPFPDAMFDRVLVVHGLESAESLRPLLRQLWRVLAPSGKLLLVAPNRTSLWAQIERSPFAHGRPFNRSQLGTTLRDTLFVADRWDSALFMPPLRSRRFLGRGVSWEKAGRRLWPALAGVHIVEATKSMYALSPPVAAKQEQRVFASAGG
ncbi:MAG TPA: methyltransferase domain-containing protein [Rhizomicrobium sp.]|nr:methyltransferase domain-containing protein [Rhizomicrobium sp.]